MHPARILTIGTLLLLVGCGNQPPESTPAAEVHSGVTGLVHLGPQCPVESIDEPCEDQPVGDVSVTISTQLPGEAYAFGPVIARSTTNADGRFRVDVAPGDYVVTAEAGMSCDLMDVHVDSGDYSSVDIACDTGIR